MQSNRYKFLELLFIFVLIPVSFAFNYSPILKLIIGVLGFTYISYVLFKIEKIKLKIEKNINWKSFWSSILIKFVIIAIITTGFVWFTDQENLFNVVLNKPLLWIAILLFYSIFSVYPQELSFLNAIKIYLKTKHYLYL